MVKKLNIEEFNSLIDRTQLYLQEYGRGKIRTGQAYMSVLHALRPDMYEEVTAKDGVDPFYNDKHIPNFLIYIGDKDVNNFLNLSKHGR